MKIRFLGADKVVTGSCHMLEVGSKKILLDCGMFQGPKLIRSLNRKPFAFHPGEIDAVVLSHAHVDHSGLLPRLVKEGFKGPIYCTHVTKELCEILLPDCGHIQEQDAEIETRKGLCKGKEAVTPLYTVDDSYLALKQFVCHDYDENFEICDGVTIRFRVAGHILGSALVNVIVRENGKETKLIYTGDIGQPNVPILDDPHQLSGGMRQRVMIAMAVSCEPRLLIADEPTTALDVTIQAQILELMEDIRAKKNTGILMITHDLGVVAEMCSRVVVMYAGRIVEEAPVQELFADPKHPYTQGLIGSVPKLGSGVESLPSIPGSVPDLSVMPKGCKFAPRCKYAMDICHQQEPELADINEAGTRKCRCHLLNKTGKEA